MTIKGFNQATGIWETVTGDIGTTLAIGADGSWQAISGIKTLIGTISQAGAAEPTIVEYYNTLNTNYTLNYLAAGQYNIVFDDEILTANIFSLASLSGWLECIVDKPDTLNINSLNFSNNKVDNLLTNTPFEIRIYPI